MIADLYLHKQGSCLAAITLFIAWYLHTAAGVVACSPAPSCWRGVELLLLFLPDLCNSIHHHAAASFAYRREKAAVCIRLGGTETTFRTPAERASIHFTLHTELDLQLLYGVHKPYHNGMKKRHAGIFSDRVYFQKLHLDCSSYRFKGKRINQ
ncbi:hypothetical protein PAHAL_6G001600 [Panicum hallii]|jgi:hypothetical protein|uniref:Uncharacterized protein n=1 Tax=Panicum hallii TaxID=206008 RepID=A0A2T8IEM1_9POAL|nr:hypothetical protein PAHAL_6G001600 [Panicum hallii]